MGNAPSITSYYAKSLQLQTPKRMAKKLRPVDCVTFIKRLHGICDAIA